MLKKIIILVLVVISIGLLYYFFREDPINEYYFKPKLCRLMTGYSFKFLSKSECQFIIDEAEKNEWTKKRHKYYPTIDQQIKDIPSVSFLFKKIENKIYPFLKEKYQIENAYINDFFIVKYDTSNGGMNKLDIHRDTSVINIIVSLNSLNEYDGGGTYFPEFKKVIKPQQGHVLVSTGKMKHGGFKITRGTRYILIGFIDVKDSIINNNYLNTIEFKLKEPDLTVMNRIFKKTIDVYIINLDHRKERLKNILTHLEKAKMNLPHGYKVNIIKISANTGETDLKVYPHWKINKDDPIFIKHKDNIEDIRYYWIRDIKKTEIGCFMSHLNTMKLIQKKNNNEDVINIVLEDDANIHTNFFYSVMETYEELMIHDIKWDLCFLGRYIVKKGKSISDNLEETGYSFNTHCYLISNNGVNKLSSINLNKKLIPYDEFLTACSKSHFREDLNKLYFDNKNKLRSYSTKKEISWQKDFGYSDID